MVSDEYGQVKWSNYIYENNITLRRMVNEFICYKTYGLIYLTKVQLVEDNKSTSLICYGVL